MFACINYDMGSRKFPISDLQPQLAVNRDSSGACVFSSMSLSEVKCRKCPAVTVEASESVKEWRP